MRSPATLWRPSSWPGSWWRDLSRVSHSSGTAHSLELRGSGARLAEADLLEGVLPTAPWHHVSFGHVVVPNRDMWCNTAESKRQASQSAHGQR